MTVVGNVHIIHNLFLDKRNTLQNITVTATKQGIIVEQHSCTFHNLKRDRLSYKLISDVGECCNNETKFQFTKLEVAVGYSFSIEICNFAGCDAKEKEHDTTNWNCGAEDGHTTISTRQICDSKPDCQIGKRDEQESICQGSPFARNISLSIFAYMFVVLICLLSLRTEDTLNAKNTLMIQRQ